MSLQSVIEDALRLPREQREHLVEALLERLDIPYAKSDEPLGSELADGEADDDANRIEQNAPDTEDAKDAERA